MPDPCGVPTSTGSHRPLSRMPALSHRSIKRRTRGSAILCLNIRTNQPWSTVSKKGSDVEIKHPVHTLRHQRFFQGGQGRMRATPRPEAVAEAYKVGLVDGIQDFGYRALDNLVLERRYAERPTAAVAFRDVCAAYRLWPVLPTVDPLV